MQMQTYMHEPKHDPQSNEPHGTPTGHGRSYACQDGGHQSCTSEQCLGTHVVGELAADHLGYDVQVEIRGKDDALRVG